MFRKGAGLNIQDEHRIGSRNRRCEKAQERLDQERLTSVPGFKQLKGDLG
jgi:hypothetical protein